MANKRSSTRTAGEPAGPTEQGGFGAGTLPPNPSDAIRGGAALPLMLPDAMTMCRPFTQVTKNPLHYTDGPGTDEIVTSRRTMPAIEHILGKPDHIALDEHQYGEDPHQYSHGPNDEFTSAGAWIRGT